jgi:hypothetical protein
MPDEAPMPDGGGQQAPPADPNADRMADNTAMRQLIMQIGQLAQKNPEAAQELQAAAKALTAASLKMVAGKQEQTQQTPLVGA